MSFKRRNILILNGKWKLYYCPQNEMNIQNPCEVKKLLANCIDATVPGNVEIDLQRAGILQDPFYGDNINGLKAYESYQWIYEKEFDTPVFQEGQRLEIVFHGVDCIADYWMNGEMLGRSDNMFIEQKFDITQQVVPEGRNNLTVIIKSPFIEALKYEYNPHMSAFSTNWEQLWVRKAPHNYGWDIMTRALSAGLWRSVEIVTHENNEISECYFYTISIDEDKARMGFFYRLQYEAEWTGKLQLQVKGRCGESTFHSFKNVNFISGFMEFDVENPKLWWPRGYGEANLYDVTVELQSSGRVLDTVQSMIGIRTVELERSEKTDGNGKNTFLFKINHTNIMCKGSNWVPVDAFHSRDAERYPMIFDLVLELNCNILRCWGGNVYEDHAFFELCDRYGIMVWQDFAMACAMYPQDSEYFSAIKKEAVSVVKKLRNHPSLILWCGDNECDYIYYERKMDPNLNRITREILPEAVFHHDPFRQYIPSSPYFSPGVVAAKNTELLSEDHLWGPRNYYKSRYYLESKAGFIGEIGYHGCPNLSSIKRFIDESHLWPWENNSQWITHCTAPEGKGSPFAYRINLMANQIKELFGVIPANPDDFILASQISQAEAKKFFIESTRLKKWDRAGIIWWNLIDGWPQFSDAIVDYYFGRKLAYQYIKRVQEKVCIMVEEPEGWDVRFIAGNDSMEDTSGCYKIWDADTGEVLSEGKFTVKANDNTVLGKKSVSMGNHRLFLMEWEICGKRYGNHYLLGYPPFKLEVYKEWLKKIAALPSPFDAEHVGK